jgi:redox-sensing transcriptional repressor
MKYHKIPDETIRRMPMYLRALSLLEEETQHTISSRQLAQRLHLNPPQIRKDLSYFGAFGTRGIGYPVASTAQQIRGILKLDIRQKAALIGAGRLGTAIAAYPGFALFGFDIAAIFDNAPNKIGKKIGRIIVEDSADLESLKTRKIHLAILHSRRSRPTLCRIPCEGGQGHPIFACYLSVPRRLSRLD